MPEGGNQARSEAMTELALMQHELATAPYLGKWFEQAETEALDALLAKNLALFSIRVISALTPMK